MLWRLADTLAIAGKSETIKQRRVDVYAHTKESKGGWQVAANVKGLPLSRYAGQILEVSLGDGTEDPRAETDGLRSRLLDLESEHAELQRRLEDSETLRHSLDGELETCRAQGFLAEAPFKKLDACVVACFADARSHRMACERLRHQSSTNSFAWTGLTSNDFRH